MFWGSFPIPSDFYLISLIRHEEMGTDPGGFEDKSIFMLYKIKNCNKHKAVSFIYTDNKDRMVHEERNPLQGQLSP